MKRSKKLAQKKSGKLTKKDIKLLQILKSNPEGLRVTTISNLLKLAIRTAYNRLYKLEKLNLVANITPIWKLCHFHTKGIKLAELLRSKEVQTHKFSFILKLIDKPHWWEKRDNKLLKLKEFQFKNIQPKQYNYIQLKKDQFLIHTFPNSIFFINQRNYLGITSYGCLEEAILDTLDMLTFIEERFNFKFFKDGIPQFSIRTNHYVKLRDEVAKICRKKKSLFRIEINGELRALIDLSEPFGREFVNKDYGVEDVEKIRIHTKDLMEKNPPVNSELDESIKELDSKLVLLSEKLLDMETVLEQNVNIQSKIIKRLYGGK